MLAGQYDSIAYQTIMLTIYNVSYTVALYYLLVFYLATKEACAPFHPVSFFHRTFDTPLKWFEIPWKFKKNEILKYSLLRPR